MPMKGLFVLSLAALALSGSRAFAEFDVRLSEGTCAAAVVDLAAIRRLAPSAFGPMREGLLRYAERNPWAKDRTDRVLAKLDWWQPSAVVSKLRECGIGIENLSWASVGMMNDVYWLPRREILTNRSFQVTLEGVDCEWDRISKFAERKFAHVEKQRAFGVRHWNFSLYDASSFGFAFSCTTGRCGRVYLSNGKRSAWDLYESDEARDARYEGFGNLAAGEVARVAVVDFDARLDWSSFEPCTFRDLLMQMPSDQETKVAVNRLNRAELSLFWRDGQVWATLQLAFADESTVRDIVADVRKTEKELPFKMTIGHDGSRLVAETGKYPAAEFFGTLGEGFLTEFVGLSFR